MHAHDRFLPEWFSRIRSRQITLPRFQRFVAWGHSEVSGLPMNSFVFLWMLTAQLASDDKLPIDEVKGAEETVATFSIVARDPATGELGLAVQSRAFRAGRTVVPSINSIPGRQGLLGPGLSSCQCFGQHHGDRGIEARPRTPRLVSHRHRVKRSELRQRDDCNNDGGRRPSEWLSRAPSKATAQVVARGHLSRAINESGRNDSSRRIRAGFA